MWRKQFAQGFMCAVSTFIVLITAFVSVYAQGRDLRGGRVVIDDDGLDGTVNTLLIEAPNPLPVNTTLTIPNPGVGAANFLLSESPGPQLVNADFVFMGSVDLTGATLQGVTLTSNASLVGNGSILTPFGLNLANPNTWTATQTFSNLNATGTVGATAFSDGTALLSGGILDLGVGGDDDLTAADVADLTDGGETTLHNHDGRYYTETELGSTANSQGASLIGIEDAGGNFTASDVESALAELVSGGLTAPVGDAYLTASASGTLTAERVLTGGTGVSLVDGGANSTMTIAIGQDVGTTAVPTFAGLTATGTVEATAFSDGTALLSGGILDLGVGGDDDLTAADVADLTDGGETTLHNHDGRYYTETELGSTGNGQGASLIGIEDAGGNFAATDVESALAELAAGGGSGAPVGDTYLTASASGTLTAERVLTGGTGVSLVDGGANSTMTVNIGQDVATTATPTFAGLNVSSGNVGIVTGNLSITTGNFSIITGNISTTVGNISTSNGNVSVGNGGELRLVEPGGSDYSAFKAQAQAGNVTYTLPAADGSNGQALTTNGSGTLSWTTPTPSSGLAAVGGIVFARKTANEGVTSSTTLQNDDHLSVALNANQSYQVEGVLYVSTTNNGHDLQLAFTVPTGSAMKVSYNSVEANSTNSRDKDILTTSGTAGRVVNVQAANTAIVYINGLVRTAGNTGNLTLQWADDNSGGTETVTVETDSYLKVTRVQ